MNSAPSAFGEAIDERPKPDALHRALDYMKLLSHSVIASASNLLEQSLVLLGPSAEQCNGFGELFAGWREAVINMRWDNWMNQSV